ncbi:MAG TPA: diguanylate cyclase [Desulfomonilaceae bacterium]|nr:diguanylate cyclase [Desulfomonilaceae bacterium]
MQEKPYDRHIALPKKRLPSTDTIDLNSLFAADAALSGSFDLSGLRTTEFAKLLNALPIPALVVDADHRVILANESCVAVGFEPETIQGKNISVLFFDADQAREAVFQIDNVLSKRKSRTGQFILGVGGSRIWARLRMRSLRLGDFRSVFLLVEDRTLEREHEQQLEIANEELERRVQERTSELMNINRQLMQEIVLRKNAEFKYRSIFENAPISIWEQDLSEVKTALARLRTEGVEDFRQYFDEHPEFVREAIQKIRVVDVNDATVRLHNAQSKEDLLGSPERVLVSDSLDTVKQELVALADGKTFFEGESVEQTLQGERRDVLVKMIIPQESARFKHTLVGKLDITERKRFERALIEAKTEWERTFDAVPDLIAIIDAHYRLIRVNKAMADRMGSSPDSVIGFPCFQLFHRTPKPPRRCPHAQMMIDGKEHLVEMIDKKMGAAFLVSVTPLHDGEGNLIGSVHVARDITKRKRLEEQLQYHATRDSLTDLLNRRSFLELLRTECSNAQRYAVPLSLGICDLDDFKQINDSHGHQAGDHVLQLFGKILKEQLRGGDMAGRYGGDEFIIAFPHTLSDGAAESMERVRKQLDLSVFTDSAGNEYRVSCTAGVAEMQDGMQYDQLIYEADKALYTAKTRGGNRVVIREPAEVFESNAGDQ